MSKTFTEQLLDDMLYDFEHQIRNGIMGYVSKQMAYHSNKIEGSTLTPEQTASLFETGTVTSNGVEVYRAKDIEETTGHFKMFNEMLKTLDVPINAKLMKRFHYQLKSGVFEDYANGYAIGAFKKRPNVIGMNQTVLPEDVPDKIEELLCEYNNSTEDVITKLARFHSRYEIIHPFQDGNGRTGRMLLFRQCLDHKIVPAVVFAEDKIEYLNTLQSAREDNLQPLCDFLRQSQQKFLTLVTPMLSVEVKSSNVFKQ